jgi:hypothetical protein
MIFLGAFLNLCDSRLAVLVTLLMTGDKDLEMKGDIHLAQCPIMNDLQEGPGLFASKLD